MILIIVPTVDKVIKQGENKADEGFKNSIILAAQNWASDNKSELNKLQKNWSYNLLISTLKEKGYIDKEIKLPSTKGAYTKYCVEITKKSGNNAKKAVYDYDFFKDNPECQITFINNELKIEGKEDITNGKNLSESGQWTKENVRLTATSTNNSITNASSYNWFNNNSRVDTTNTNQHVVKVNNNEVKTFNYTATLINGSESTQKQKTSFVANSYQQVPSGIRDAGGMTIRFTPVDTTNYNTIKKNLSISYQP